MIINCNYSTSLFGLKIIRFELSEAVALLVPFLAFIICVALLLINVEIE